MEREREAEAAAADRILNKYETNRDGQTFSNYLFDIITRNQAIISPSLVPINGSPAKTNNSQLQARPPRYPKSNGNELPEISPFETHSEDSLRVNSFNITTRTKTLLSNVDGTVKISPSVSVDRTNVGKANNPNNPNNEGSILDKSSLGLQFRSLSQKNDEARVESQRPPTPIIHPPGPQVDERNQSGPFSCHSVYDAKEATSEELPQNAQTEQARKTTHGEQLQTTPPAQIRQPTPTTVSEIDGFQVDGESDSTPNPFQQSEQDNPLQAQLLEQSPENHTEIGQTVPPGKAEQTAEIEQIAPPAQIRQPTPPTVSEIDEEELYTDIPLEASEQTAQANSLQTQSATQTAGVEQTAETKQNADKVVYDDIPLASEQTAQANSLQIQLPESEVDVLIPNQTAQPATQTAGADKAVGIRQIAPPAPDEQVAGTLQPAQPATQPAQASLGYAGQVNPEQVGGIPSSLCAPRTLNRAENSQREGCFSSCAIS